MSNKTSLKKINFLSVVVVVVEKDKTYLKRCLSSLEKSATYANISLEINIIANGTKLSQLDYLNSPYKIIHNDKNIGLARANNQGMMYAHGEWCIILAPDTKAKPDTLKLLLKAVNNDKIAIVEPKIYFADGSLDYSILPLPNLLNIFLEQSYLYKFFPYIFHHSFSDKSFYDARHEVEALASTFWLIKKEYFDRIGGFDPRFFLFYEDTDLCKRITKNNLKIIIEPKAEIIHYGHRSNDGVIRGDLLADSLSKYLQKYYSRNYFIIAFLIFILGCLARLIFWKIRYNTTNSYIIKNSRKKKIIFCEQALNKSLYILKIFLF